MTTAQLEQQAQAIGHFDEEAFAALVTRHAPRAFWAANKSLGDREASRDAAQEAFIRLEPRLLGLLDSTLMSL
jgi:DNA-directed RNA polymerase specialized sigma24 family protein